MDYYQTHLVHRHVPRCIRRPDQRCSGDREGGRDAKETDLVPYFRIERPLTLLAAAGRQDRHHSAQQVPQRGGASLPGERDKDRIIGLSAIEQGRVGLAWLMLGGRVSSRKSRELRASSNLCAFVADTARGDSGN